MSTRERPYPYLPPGGDRRQGEVTHPRVLGTCDGGDADRMVLKIREAIVAHVSATDDDDAGDPSVMDELRTEDAGFACDEEPRALGWNAGSRTVSDDIPL